MQGDGCESGHSRQSLKKRQAPAIGCAIACAKSGSLFGRWLTQYVSNEHNAA